jgi:L-fuculose-phosphate aldolase
MYADKYKKEVETFVEVAHQLADQMYVTGYGGNLAWKLENDLILITPTMMNKGDIKPQDVVFINMKGETLEGNRRPTGEKLMYLKFFNERPDIVSVLHCHAPNVCACAIMEKEDVLMRPFFPETVTEVGPVPLVPYGQPLTDDLAQKFSPFVQKYNSFLMENHGLVTMSTDDIKWTKMNVDLLEMSAKSILAVLMSGQTLKELKPSDVEDLGNVMQERGLPLFGAPGVNTSLQGMYF